MTPDTATWLQRAKTDKVTDIGQLSPETTRALDCAWRKGELIKGHDLFWSGHHHAWAAPNRCHCWFGNIISPVKERNA